MVKINLLFWQYSIQTLENAIIKIYNCLKHFLKIKAVLDSNIKSNIKGKCFKKSEASYFVYICIYVLELSVQVVHMVTVTKVHKNIDKNRALLAVLKQQVWNWFRISCANSMFRYISEISPAKSILK